MNESFSSLVESAKSLIGSEMTVELQDAIKTLEEYAREQKD